MKHGEVLIVYGVPPDMWSNQDVFNLFCVFGNVMKCRTLRQERGAALVQMAEVSQAEYCIKHLSGAMVRGRRITIEFSRHAAIEGPDGAVLDTSTSRLNRFKKGKAKTVFPPSAVVHFSNGHPNATSESLRALLKSLACPQPLAIKFFASKEEQKLSAARAALEKSLSSSVVSPSNAAAEAARASEPLSSAAASTGDGVDGSFVREFRATESGDNAHDMSTQDDAPANGGAESAQPAAAAGAPSQEAPPAPGSGADDTTAAVPSAPAADAADAAAAPTAASSAVDGSAPEAPAGASADDGVSAPVVDTAALAAGAPVTMDDSFIVASPQNASASRSGVDHADLVNISGVDLSAIMSPSAVHNPPAVDTSIVSMSKHAEDVISPHSVASAGSSASNRSSVHATIGLIQFVTTDDAIEAVLRANNHVDDGYTLKLSFSQHVVL